MKLAIISVFSLLIGLFSSNLLANIDDRIIRSLAHCVKVSEDTKRLNCFDQLASSNMAALNKIKIVREEKKKQIASSNEPVSKYIDDFSKSNLKKTESVDGPDSITATISHLTTLIRGQWVISFDNGQKWQQTDTVKLRLAINDIVKLKKGSFGSVFLNKEGVNRNIRVKRLK